VGPASSDEPDVSEFTKDLMRDLSAGRYRGAAWRKFFGDSWRRSVDDVRANVSRARSFRSWATLTALIGLGVLLLPLAAGVGEGLLEAGLIWVPWFASSVAFAALHLGMVDSSDGEPLDRFLLPNALSFARLALAPLVYWPMLSVAATRDTGLLLAAFLALMSVTDVIDGRLARAREQCTRMGRMLDHTADIAFLAFLAAGLHHAGLLPTGLFALLMVRYPGSFAGVAVLYFVAGPVPLRPTVIGRGSSLLVNVVLVTVAALYLVQSPHLDHAWVEWAMWCLYGAVGANLLYLVARARAL